MKVLKNNMNLQQAFKSRRLYHCRRAFREFVQTNPEHDLAGNAQYWYAETFRIRQLYTDAASAYRGYQKYPKGEKAPVNLLKFGVSMVQIGEKDQGCK